MNFEQLLVTAKNNASESKAGIFDMYRPLLIKESLVNGSFDEDLYQELQEVLLKAIKAFPI